MSEMNVAALSSTQSKAVNHDQKTEKQSAAADESIWGTAESQDNFECDPLPDVTDSDLENIDQDYKEDDGKVSFLDSANSFAKGVAKGIGKLFDGISDIIHSEPKETQENETQDNEQ